MQNRQDVILGGFVFALEGLSKNRLNNQTFL